MNVREPSPSLLAARLALLALRSTIGQATPLVADRVLLDAADSPMSTDDAAQLLASKPKPLFCDAEARDGVLVVHSRAEAEADAYERQLHATPRYPAEWGGFMGHLEAQYGPGDHLVAVFGREESLILPHSVVDRWSREYEIVGVGYAGDNVDNPLAQSREEYIEARRRGAKGFLRFDSSADSRGKVYSATIALYGDANPEVSKEAEERLVELARTDRLFLESVSRNDPASDLMVSQSAWGAWLRKQVQGEKGRLVRTAEMLKQVFKGKTMPADVAAFVEDCDKHFGPSS